MPLPLPLLVPWVVAVSFLALFVVLGAAGWPGEFAAAGGMFCEAFDGPWGEQTANTYSNLGFVAAGLWMAGRAAALPRGPAVGRNLFARSAAMPGLYAALVVFLGPGSMFMHGSGREWGATADVVSMILWIAFPVAYGAARCFGLGERGFWIVYLVLALGLGVPRSLGGLPFSGSLTYAVLIPAIAFFETRVVRRPETTQPVRYLLGAAASFAIALTVWRLSHTGAPLCDPHSLLQGHAAWHLLCAVSTAGIFLYYVGEDDGGA